MAEWSTNTNRFQGYRKILRAAEFIPNRRGCLGAHIAAAPAPRTAGPTDGHMGDKPWLQPIPRAADAGGAGGGDVRCPTACAALPLLACCMHVLRCPTTCNHSFA